METKTIRLHDKTFRVAIPYGTLKKSIAELAGRINKDYQGHESPLFVGVLNGSFMFMSELMKNIDFDCRISFVKIASYQGMHCSSAITELIGLTDNIKDRHIIIVEDIVDTGNSIEHLIKSLVGHEPASIAVAALLFKPECYTKERPVDYYAMEVPDKFIVGFGLDYDGLGRNYKDIYEIAE